MIKVAASKYLGQVAQLVEHGPEKAGVGGSSPPLTTFLPTSGETHPKKSRNQRFLRLFCSDGLYLPARSPGCWARSWDLPRHQSVPNRMLFASFLTFFPADCCSSPLFPQPKSVPAMYSRQFFSQHHNHCELKDVLRSQNEQNSGCLEFFTSVLTMVSSCMVSI